MFFHHCHSVFCEFNSHLQLFAYLVTFIFSSCSSEHNVSGQCSSEAESASTLAYMCFSLQPLPLHGALNSPVSAVHYGTRMSDDSSKNQLVQKPTRPNTNLAKDHFGQKAKTNSAKLKVVNSAKLFFGAQLDHSVVF